MKHSFWGTKGKVLFLLYGILMLWLLFGRGVTWQGDYWAQVRGNLNLIPFRTVMLYVHLLQETHSHALIRHAVINLTGNVVMFIPLGLLLPQVCIKLQKAWRFFPAMILMICMVEGTQLFTLVGSCDVDDLILNMVGIWIGFVLFKRQKKNSE